MTKVITMRLRGTAGSHWRSFSCNFKCMHKSRSPCKCCLIVDLSFNLHDACFLEKELVRKKREEVEEAERAKRSKVVMTFDMLGRKVLVNDDDTSEELQNGVFLRTSKERDEIRIKPNPNLNIQPIFIDPGPRRTLMDNTLNKESSHGLCLEINGRVQHGANELESCNHWMFEATEFLEGR